MDYIDKYTFEQYIDKAFELPLDQKNAIYFNICDIIFGIDNEIDKDKREAIALQMIHLLDEFLAVRKEELEFKAAEKSEGKIPGGVFRRVT
jgi:hypothetical protein